MRIAIAGAGKVGRYIARDLAGQGHEIILLEANRDVIARHRDEITAEWMRADACEVSSLDVAGLEIALYSLGADGRHDGLLVHRILASYTHRRSTGHDGWAPRFVAHVRATETPPAEGAAFGLEDGERFVVHRLGGGAIGLVLEERNGQKVAKGDTRYFHAGT